MPQIFSYANRKPALRQNGLIQSISEISLKDEDFDLFLSKNLDPKQQDIFHQYR